MHRLVRVVLGHRLSEHVPEGHTKALHHRAKRRKHFAEWISHSREFNRAMPGGQTTGLPYPFRAFMICFPWNRPFSIKISLVCRPPITTPARCNPGTLLSKEFGSSAGFFVCGSSFTPKLSMNS